MVPFYTGLTVVYDLPVTQFGIYLQMRAQAYDLGEPQLTGGEVNITVTVIRNNNPPFFVNAPYIRTINENFNIGEVVYDTTASDIDTQVNYDTILLNKLPLTLNLLNYSTFHYH